MSQGKGRLSTRRSLTSAWSTNDKTKRKDSSKPKSLKHKGDRKQAYDTGPKKIRCSDTAKSKAMDDPKRTHHNKEEALKGICASL
jgi:hypothetical protein